MQIFEKYKGDYTTAIEKFKEVRREYLEELSNVKNLRVVPTQANYVLCEILGDNTAYDITKRLLDEYDIFIKDLSSKKGFNGQYIRVAVKRPEENRKLVEALKTILE